MKTGWKSVIPEAVGLVAILVTTVVLYWPSLNGGWNFDDMGHIINNPAMRLESLSASGLGQAFSGPLKNRPLAYLTFALDYWRAGGFEPRAYHVTNLVIHLAAVGLAWLFLRALLAAPVFGLPWPRAAALAGAAVFALHPVQLQSAAYVVQRMNLLAGLFTLLTLYLWLLGREQKGRARLACFTSAVIAAIIGLGCKETTASLALFIPILDLCLSGQSLRDWARRRRLWLAGLAAAALILGSLLFIGGNGLSGYARRDFTAADRLLTQPRVILWYASAWLFPAPQRLSLEHDFPVSRAPLSPLTTLPAIAALLALTALALMGARRAPLLALGWLWFVAGLALESSILPLEMVFEHRLYLPGIGLCLCCADLLHRAGAGRRQGIAVAIAITFVAGATFARARAWTSDLAIWHDAAGKAPKVSRPWANLCAVNYSRGRIDPAIGACLVATRLNSRDADAWFNLGMAFQAADLGGPAEDAFTHAIGERSKWAEAHYQRARVRVTRFNFEGAEADGERATEIEPKDPVYWFELARARLAVGKPAAARKALAQARAHILNAEPELRADLADVIEQVEAQTARLADSPPGGPPGASPPPGANPPPPTPAPGSAP